MRVQILIGFQTFLLFTKPHFQTFNAVFSGLSDYFRLFSQTCTHTPLIFGTRNSLAHIHVLFINHIFGENWPELLLPFIFIWDRKTGELHKAETFLTDALKVYEKEGWPLLVAANRKELAECYKRLGDQEKYPFSLPLDYCLIAQIC